jgi:hypothetical protein
LNIEDFWFNELLFSSAKFCTLSVHNKNVIITYSLVKKCKRMLKSPCELTSILVPFSWLKIQISLQLCNSTWTQTKSGKYELQYQFYGTKEDGKVYHRCNDKIPMHPGIFREICIFPNEIWLHLGIF